jgi:hypothetical protein
MAGRRHKGSLDLAKLEPAIRGTPVVESYHARVFAPVLSNRIWEQHLTTLNNLEIYETNTSNQSQSARFPEFSVNGLLLSSDRRRQVGFLCRSPGKESARLLQIKQRILRRRNEPGLHRRAFVLYSDRWHRRLAGHVDAHRSDSHDQELLTTSTSSAADTPGVAPRMRSIEDLSTSAVGEKLQLRVNPE